MYISVVNCAITSFYYLSSVSAKQTNALLLFRICPRYCASFMVYVNIVIIVNIEVSQVCKLLVEFLSRKQLRKRCLHKDAFSRQL